MAGKQSWAEGRWWRGTVFDWLAVLLAIATVFVLALVSVPFFLARHSASGGLQDYYRCSLPEGPYLVVARFPRDAKASRWQVSIAIVNAG